MTTTGPRKSLWEVYASAVATVSVAAIVVAAVIGGWDLVKLAFPSFTLNAALHEKYQSNEAYTDFGLFHKELSPEEITRERTANYDKLLRIEQRNALQRLLKVGLGFLAVAALNGIVVVTARRQRDRAS